MLRSGGWMMVVVLGLVPGLARAERGSFSDAVFDADREVDKAYEVFDYGTVAKTREEFLAAWREKLPVEPTDRERAERDIEAAKKEVVAAKKLAVAWKRAKKAPKKQLIPFLKEMQAVDVRRRYSEGERHGLVDLLVQAVPGARAWVEKRFPAVMEIQTSDPTDRSTLQTQLRKVFADYGWELLDRGSDEGPKRKWVVTATVAVPERSLSSVFGSSAAIKAYHGSLEAVIRGGGDMIDSANVGSSGMGISEASGHADALKKAALRLRTVFGDKLIEAARDGAL